MPTEVSQASRLNEVIALLYHELLSDTAPVLVPLRAAVVYKARREERVRPSAVSIPGCGLVGFADGIGKPMRFAKLRSWKFRYGRPVAGLSLRYVTCRVVGGQEGDILRARRLSRLSLQAGG